MPNVIHMNPRIWGPNADKFDPDRWDSPAVKAAPPYAFAAFLTGPTGCIGRAFAMLEIKIILIELLRRFELEAVAGTPVELVNPGPLLRPKGGLKIRAGVANV
jgi:cytochrome P450